MKKIVVLLGLIVFSFQFSVFSQDLKYIFDKGQVLQYEHVFERTFDYSISKSTSEQIKILEFEVMDIQRNKYLMNLKVRSAYTRITKIDEFDEESVVFRTAFDSTGTSLINYADMGRTIEFEMNVKGEVIEIRGIEEFQKEVALIIHTQKRSAYKALVPYGYLTSRISSEYYTLLINDIFPVLSRIGDPSITEKNPWKINTREIHSHQKWAQEESEKNSYAFEKSYYNTLRDHPDSVIGYLENQPGILDWDPENHSISSLNYGTIDHLRIISSAWRNDYYFIIGRGIKSREINDKGQIRVKRLGEYELSNKPAHIIGNILGCDSCKIVVNFPTRSLSPDTRVHTINKQGGSVNISGDLPYGPDVVTIYFPENYALYLSYESDPRQIRLFVRPGDTIKFTVDLRRFGKNLGFFGPTWKEQELLNSYILGYSELNPRITISDIQKARTEFEQNKNYYCNEFINWFQFESQYEELEYRLNEIRGPNINTIDFNQTDSLTSFSRYLNHHNGYKSAAYKRFIKRMALTYSSTAQYKGLTGDPYLNMMESVGIVLKGWDKYYVLADLTEARLGNFSSPVTQTYYNYFIRLYRGSDYANMIENQWEKYQKILPGERIPEFKFTDINGDKYSIRDFWGEVVTLATIKEIKRPRKRAIPSNIIKETQKMIYEAEIKRRYRQNNYRVIYFYLCDSIPSNQYFDSLPGEPSIYVTDKKSVDNYLKIINGSRELTIALDKDQRIARINSWPSSSNATYNLDSWPQLEEVIETPKTVNRRTLWLILTILVTTAIFIFLMIWERNKRREAKLAEKRKMAELELGAVRSRMNPHFLFNSLSSIQNLVNGDEIEKANLYLADFGDIVRRILDQSSKNQITLEEELETLNTYLTLEKLRFPFEFSITVSEDINPQEIEIPPLFIQPHVENAIIHGLSGLEGKGVLNIDFKLVDDNLEVLIVDNGPGLNKKTISNGLGKGWELTNQRVLLLKDQWGKNISVSRISDDDKSGMRVKFVIPLEIKHS